MANTSEALVRCVSSWWWRISPKKIERGAPLITFLGGPTGRTLGPLIQREGPTTAFCVSQNQRQTVPGIGRSPSTVDGRATSFGEPGAGRARQQGPGLCKRPQADPVLSRASVVRKAPRGAHGKPVSESRSRPPGFGNKAMPSAGEKSVPFEKQLRMSCGPKETGARPCLGAHSGRARSRHPPMS